MNDQFFFSFSNERIESTSMRSSNSWIVPILLERNLKNKKIEKKLTLHVSLACRTFLFKVCSLWDYIRKVSINCLRYFVDETSRVHSYFESIVLDAYH